MQSVSMTEAHLSQLGKQLSCPICLRLLKKAVNLSCSHVFCATCAEEATKRQPQCPICKIPTTRREMRPAPHLDSMVEVYRKMEEDSGVSIHCTQPGESFDAKASEEESHNEVCTMFASEKHLKAGSWSLTGCPNENCIKSEVSMSHPTEKRVSDNVTKDNALEPFFWLKEQTEETEETEFDECDSQVHITQTPQVNPTPRPTFSDLQEESQKGSERSERNNKRSSLDSETTKKTAKRCLNLSSALNPDRGQEPVEEGKCILSDSEDENIKGRDEENTNAGTQIKNMTKRKVILGVDKTESKLNSKGKPAHLKKAEAESGKEKKLTNRAQDVKDLICGFCGTTGNSKEAGQMMTVENGGNIMKSSCFLKKAKPSTGQEHVHENCLEWAPAVYFHGEKVKNLKSELNRSSRLKCSVCNSKGAALGCYVPQCRKSYHFSCARKVSGCLWNEDEYVVLCPEHAPQGFPELEKNEKVVNKDVGEINNPEPEEQSPHSELEWSLHDSSKWVLCGSGLDKKGKESMAEFSQLTGATIAKQWSNNVTHLVTGVDESGRTKRTLKYLCAILRGQWIVSAKWMEVCTLNKKPMKESLFEIAKDIHDMVGGAEKGRIHTRENKNTFFDGMSVYFHGDYDLPSKADLATILTVGGGIVLSEKPGPTLQSDVVIYNDSLPKGRLDPADEEKIILSRRDEAAKAAAGTMAVVLPHTWILDSVAGFQLLPFFPVE